MPIDDGPVTHARFSLTKSSPGLHCRFAACLVFLIALLLPLPVLGAPSAGPAIGTASAQADNDNDGIEDEFDPDDDNDGVMDDQDHAPEKAGPPPAETPDIIAPDQDSDADGIPNDMDPDDDNDDVEDDEDPAPFTPVPPEQTPAPPTQAPPDPESSHPPAGENSGGPAPARPNDPQPHPVASGPVSTDGASLVVGLPSTGTGPMMVSGNGPTESKSWLTLLSVLLAGMTILGRNQPAKRTSRPMGEEGKNRG